MPQTEQVPSTEALAVEALASPTDDAPIAVQSTEGLSLRIVGDSTVVAMVDGTPTAFVKGDVIVVDHAAFAWSLITAGHARVIDEAGELLPETDQTVLLDFALRGVKFDPSDWAKWKKGKA